MSKNIKILTVLVLFLLLFLALSGIVGGPFSEVLYLAGFALPLFFGYAYSVKDRKRREEERGLKEGADRLFFISSQSLLLMLPLVFAAVGLIFLISFVTSLLLALFGMAPDARIEGNFLYLVAAYAFAPAVLEELVFRYLPIKLLSPYSGKAVLIVSSIYFGFFHMDFAKIPYALAAGIIFMWIDLALGSVWPSVIMHFVNNVTSLIWLRCDGYNAIIFVSVLAVLVAVSIILIVLNRKIYLIVFKKVIKDDTGAKISHIIWIVPLISVIESIAKLIFGEGV